MRILLLIILFSTAGMLAFRYQPQPFTVSTDMAITNQYGDHVLVKEKSAYGSTQYTQKTKKLLAAMPREDLQDIRCSDSFMRTDQGVYIFENIRINHMTKKSIKNKMLLEFMRNKERELPRGKKILTGRVCETENNTIFLFYSIGTYNIKDIGSLTIRTVIAYSADNEAYVQILPKNPFGAQKILRIATSKDHIRCDQPFQVSKKTLILLCEEEKEWVSTYTVYQTDLKRGTRTVFETCTNTFKGSLQSSCN